MGQFEAAVDVGHDKAARLVALAAPDLHGTTLWKVGEGWDFQAFEVDDEWIVRFPKSQSAAGKLKFERKFLPILSNYLAAPIPRYEIWSEGGEGFPFPFGGYRKLQGTTLEEYPSASTITFQAMEQLGQALRCLHEFSGEVARNAGIQTSMSDRLSEVVSQRHLLEESLPEELMSRCSRYVFGEVTEPLLPPDQQRLTHADLGMDHVLVDDNGNISGIIDWSDMVIGDVAADFAHVWLWGGESALSTAVQAYGLHETAEFFRRVRFIGRCHALRVAAEEIERGLITRGSTPKQVWRAFEEESQ